MSRAIKWAAPAVSRTAEIGGVPATVSASGNSDPITIGRADRVLAFVQVGSPTGSSPTLNVVVETREPSGVWLPVITLTQLTAASYTYAAAGPGTANTYVLGDQVRFRWTLGGTSTPTFPSFVVSLIGR